MNDKVILRKLLKHVIFGMMPVVTILCVALTTLITYWLFTASSLWWIVGYFVVFAIFLITFFLSWINPARVHYLIELLPEDARYHINRHFETVCLNGNMREYIDGVANYERNLETGQFAKYWLDKGSDFRPSSHGSQAYIIGYFIRSITKWA